ncbi:MULTISPECIES: hypothetical protein [Burkholderia cepacia complex]|uniref:hypothetical protein n=1 Tax=Burkholderia cepacia complex TaxID=87882 RepID=UPI0020134A5B|nr:hypothetical protein [Burkholderia cenocepacia]
MTGRSRALARVAVVRPSVGDGLASVKPRQREGDLTPIGDAFETGDRVMAFAWLGVILFGTLPTVQHLERRHPKLIDAERPCAPRAPSRSRRDEPPARRPARPATADRRPDVAFGA